MLKNYFKIAVRNLLKQKGYSFINITGLAIGMACFMFIFLFIKDELSYDRFHAKSKILYRLEQDQKSPEGNYHVNVTPFPVAPALKEQIPEITNSTRFWGLGSILVRHNDLSFFETGIRFVDPSFLEMFSFTLLNGDPKTALKDNHSLIITESIAKKYFGSENPIGKTLELNNKIPFTITGLMADPPQNSSIRPAMFAPFEFLKEIGRYRDRWASNSITTFVEMPDNNNLGSVNNKITELIYSHSKGDSPNYKPDFMLNSILNIRLFGYFGFSNQNRAIQGIYIIAGIGIFILMIACINFMNLATARSANRAKEVGLRKVVGALKRHIIIQFYGESILITFLSFLLSIVFILLLLPVFNTLTDKQFSIKYLLEWQFITGAIVIVLLTGVLSGSYPALFISSLRPIKTLRGKLRDNSKNGFFRKMLVVFQFSLSIILIIGTILVYQQVNFMRNKNVGYDKEQLLYIQLRGETRNSYNILKQEFLKNTQIAAVSGMNNLPTNIGSNSWGAEWDGKDPSRQVLIGTAGVDFDYIETLKIPLLEGRSFSMDYSTDTSTAFIINEEVRKMMGVSNAVGKRFKFQGKDGFIIGVTKNFHFLPVNFEIPPLAFEVNPKSISTAVVRLAKGDIPNSIESVKKSWLKIFPNYPFDYRFFDDDFAEMYQADDRMATILKYAAIFAIFIACLGLFGLASFMAEKRTKEIGIRKALGSSISSIVILFSKEFIKWVVTSNIIAWPAAYFLSEYWLKNYAYRTSLNLWIFVLAGIMSLIVAFITVSYQSIKAARANPINSLRYE